MQLTAQHISVLKSHTLTFGRSATPPSRATFFSEMQRPPSLIIYSASKTLHGAHAPASEPFGTRLGTSYIALCVALGNIDGKPFIVAKLAAYMRVPVPRSYAGSVNCNVGVQLIARAV